MAEASNTCKLLSDYRQVLLEISNNLDNDELLKLVFLCDGLSKRCKEQIRMPFELFTCLEEKGYIKEGDVRYLRKILQQIHRNDLVAKLDTLKSDESNNLQSLQLNSSAPPLRVQQRDLKAPKPFAPSLSSSPCNLGSVPINSNIEVKKKHSSSEIAATSASSALKGQRPSSLTDSKKVDVHSDDRGSVIVKEKDAADLLKGLSLGESSKDVNTKGETSDQLEIDSAQPSVAEGGQREGLHAIADWRSPLVPARSTASRFLKGAGACYNERPTLRQYQKELAARPLENMDNYIICAPTGSGKTLTAAYICHEYWTRFKTSKRRNKNFKALFIVHMRHLTRQQRSAFQDYFPIRLDIQIIGDEQSFVEALQIDEPTPVVLMLTAQIFVNALKSSTNPVNLETLDMLIFDECHHTDQKHPFNEIMKVYLKRKFSLPLLQHLGNSGDILPCIIGLSASLGVGHDGTALDHILDLCGNMDAMGVCRVLENIPELQRHVNNPEQDIIINAQPRAVKVCEFFELLKSMMAQIAEQIPDKKSTDMLPSPGSQPYESVVSTYLLEAEKCSDRIRYIVYKYLFEYNRSLMLYDDLRIQDGLTHLEEFHEGRQLTETPDQIPTEEYCEELFRVQLADMKKMDVEEQEHGNDKLAQLDNLLFETFSKEPKSKGIILVRMKVATIAICDFIKKSTLLKSLPYRVKPRRLVGQGLNEEYCMTEAEQKDVLKSFKEDGCNVLVATDIAQEGLDMPACNFVARYNFVSNEIGTVQSKGRARAEGSKCYLIVESGSLNEDRELKNRLKVTKMEEAMAELEAMTEGDRLDKINEKQLKRIDNIRRAEEEEAGRHQREDLEQIDIKCKECSTFVCLASELRRKGDAGHVTCIRLSFQTWVKENRFAHPKRYRDSETVGLITCGTSDCRNPLGTIQRFLFIDPPDGYALKAGSFKAHFNKYGAVKILKTWNKAGFDIIKDVEN